MVSILFWLSRLAVKAVEKSRGKSELLVCDESVNKPE
jgi:hypothetical protein